MSADVVFYLLAAFAIGSALLCITQRNVLASALWLVSTMFSLAAIYVLLQAQFLAAIQVLVYAGAVMVLFLFVVMMLDINLDRLREELDPARRVERALCERTEAFLATLRPDRSGSLRPAERMQQPFPAPPSVP